MLTASLTLQILVSFGPRAFLDERSVQYLHRFVDLASVAQIASLGSLTESP